MIILSYFLSIFIKTTFSLINNKCNCLEETYRNYLLNFIHEVKNPIAVCKGYIEIIKNKKINKNEYVEIIEREINESLMIMEEYLMYGRFKVNLEYMDINLLLEEIFINFCDLTDNDKVNINFMYNDDEVIILGDYNKLKQVFVNIIKNSRESIIKKGTIKLYTKIEKNKIKIFIEDNGVGMTKSELNKIKDAFFTTKANGTGLGTYLSNEIIKLHNGSLDYSSKKNIGTKVMITLPYN